MLRKLLIFGFFAGTSASIPIIYQSNPDAFYDLVRSTVQGEQPVRKKVAVVAEAPKPREVAPVGRKVRVQTDHSGHFLADFKLNGRRVNAIVDTGATLVAINASTAKAIGISLTPADFKYQVSTANGNARAASVKIDSIQIGRIAIDDIQAVVLDDHALDETLVGMSFLNRLSKFVVENDSLLLVQ